MFIETLRRIRQDVIPGPQDLWEANEYFEGAPPQEVLDWAVETYGGGLALLASFGGSEGMALIDMISKITDEVTILTIDTGFLFKETIEFREEVMRRYRLPLEVLRPQPTVEEQVERYGERMKTCSPDLCCRIRKIEPLERALKNYDAWITGIRREQTPQRADTPVVAWDRRFGAAKIAPFAFVKEEWVHRYVAEHDVPVNPLLKKGYKSIGCEPQTRPVAPEEDARAGRWSSLDKTECGLHWTAGEARS
ncbi:MAG: phosphoadenylyl-sulfate reductase [Actinomycetota bacterium]|nr:phosphoadenylyl-sulfate reductase [Actinomycetota bacterium]